MHGYGNLALHLRGEQLTHTALARILLILLCTFQGIGTLLIDLGRSHASNPEWLRHARFHVVWQSCSTFLLSAIELGLLLIPGRLQEERFYLAAMLASIPMLGFFGALVTRKVFGSALSDPNGIPPAAVVLLGTKKWMDLNLVAEAVAFALLLVIAALFKY